MRKIKIKCQAFAIRKDMLICSFFSPAKLVASQKKSGLLLCSLILGIGMTGCGPREVNADPMGAKLLPLAGTQNVEGTLKHDLKIYGKIYAKGTQVRVLESWLIRKNPPKNPPAYRIKGRYDPAEVTSGFVLPDRAVEVYFLSAVGPSFQKNIPIPLGELMLKK